MSAMLAPTVPEPTQLTLLLTGLAWLGLRRLKLAAGARRAGNA